MSNALVGPRFGTFTRCVIVTNCELHPLPCAPTLPPSLSCPRGAPPPLLYGRNGRVSQGPRARCAHLRLFMDGHRRPRARRPHPGDHHASPLLPVSPLLCADGPPASCPPNRFTTIPSMHIPTQLWPSSSRSSWWLPSSSPTRETNRLDRPGRSARHQAPLSSKPMVGSRRLSSRTSDRCTNSTPPRATFVLQRLDEGESESTTQLSKLSLLG